MKKTILHALVSLMLALTLGACHTTEANYRASYDIAREKTRQGVGTELLGKIEAEQQRKTAIIAGDSVRMLHRYVRGVDRDPAQLKPYNVVAREFKQVANAKSMCARLRAEGHDSYVLLWPQEKTYYVVVNGYDTPQDAAAFLRQAPDKIKMRLDTTALWILHSL